jgi:hypothetical protein
VLSTGPFTHIEVPESPAHGPNLPTRRSFLSERPAAARLRRGNCAPELLRAISATGGLNRMSWEDVYLPVATMFARATSWRRIKSSPL